MGANEEGNRRERVVGAQLGDALGERGAQPVGAPGCDRELTHLPVASLASSSISCEQANSARQIVDLGATDLTWARF
jgi:hypothetical protein